MEGVFPRSFVSVGACRGGTDKRLSAGGVSVRVVKDGCEANGWLEWTANVDRLTLATKGGGSESRTRRAQAPMAWASKHGTSKSGSESRLQKVSQRALIQVMHSGRLRFIRES